MTCSVDDNASTTLVVLAGGQGQRMGRPKGDLTLNGQPILNRLIRRLHWPGPTLLVTAPGREHPPGWDQFTAEATDPVHNDGPLRGILTAIERASTNELVLIPVDMPNLTTECLSWIAQCLRASTAAAGVMLARMQDGVAQVEPFPAAFRADIAKELIRTRLRDRELSLRALAQSDLITVLPAPMEWSAALWINLNTPTEVTAYQEGTSREPGAFPRNQ